jgi:hypothetical protein
MDITFRCLPRFEATLPRPIPALQGLPQWLRDMPATVYSELQEQDTLTVKQCPPFIDAMTSGFLMPLAADVKVEDGVFTWDANDLGGETPINFHENIQVKGTPLYHDEFCLVRFNNFWTIETPPGYSLLVMHPANRPDLPFLTSTGLVDSDQYNNMFVNFSARFDPRFNGTLAKGTPVAQCFPFKRESWLPQIATMDDAAMQRLVDLSAALNSEAGVYRRQFRVPKHRR